jgi:DNA helicase-2/ATP-dependent DNA helicase PcrA
MATKKFILKKSDSNLPSISQKFKIQYEKDLNKEQFEVVKTTEGPLLVVAGAGTGKTRTLIYRVAYLIEMGVKPESILLLTFTRKSAREMLRRASLMIDDRCEKVSGGTFHSFSAGILRKYADRLNYNNSFSIIDSSDSEDVINLLRSNLKLNEEKKRFPHKSVLQDIFSKAINKIDKIENIILKDYPYYKDSLVKIEQLFLEYNKYKRKYNIMDYDDLLLNFLILIKDHPNIISSIQSKYK